MPEAGLGPRKALSLGLTAHVAAQELKGDSDDFFDGVIGVIETPKRLTTDVRDKIDGTKTTIRVRLAPIPPYVPKSL
jgi:hypothetical protein